jgi:hypothetical protein
MGNSISLYSNVQLGGDNLGSKSEEKEKNITLGDTLDFIASYYILTMDFKTLSQLHEKKYCEDLVVLSADIINKYFNYLDVKKLAQRIEYGVDDSERVFFFKKDDLQNTDIDTDIDSEDKKEYCIEIAKFYIKIAHVFSAIVTTINPEYIYKDSFGNIVKRSLMQKDSIPENAEVTVSKINLCSERINALKGSIDKVNNSDYEDGDNDEKITIHPDICNVNLDNNNETINLNDEPGINELIELYFDEDYDFKTGKFMGMTIETEKQFQNDLKRFYSTFTDNHEIPLNIKKFSDIKLKDYSKKDFCDGKNSLSVSGSYKDELFVKYANNLKSMISSVNARQDELLSIINKIFVYVLDPITKQEIIRINPELTENLLKKIIVTTRNLIIELYLKCETDFVEGVKIYEAIVESQILDTTQKHIKKLENERDKLIQSYIPNK